MKRILFINPSIKNTIFGKMKSLALPPLGLGVLASRTPDTYEVKIIDENVESLDFNQDADLVAVTATTVQAPRAYEVINKFKARSIPTVIGGIHPSVMTEEASAFADTVVVGEADEMWSVVLDDFEKGQMKSLYKMEAYPSLTGLPPVDRSIFSDRYVIHTIQTSRGCPCNCNFCSVTQFNGTKYRFRPVDEVLAEIDGIRERRLFIADDSVVGLGKRGVEHARSLFDGLKGMNKSWGSQVCITIAEHDDLLKAAADSGANTFYIGFESIDADALQSMDKSVNLRPSIRGFKDAIRKMHDHGIGVIGGFILGADSDTPDIFKRTADFILETGIDGCQFTLMTPFPGTRLYDKIKQDGRLIYTDYPEDWKRYNAYELVMKPLNMSVHELVRGQQYIYEATATLAKSFKRGVRTLYSTRSVLNAFINFSWNYYNYRAIRSM